MEFKYNLYCQIRTCLKILSLLSWCFFLSIKLITESPDGAEVKNVNKSLASCSVMLGCADGLEGKKWK